MFSKEYFTDLYSPARDRALAERNIKVGCAATGLYPFNPNKVLNDNPKPLADVVIPAIIASVDTHDPLLQAPVTLVTPVTAETLTLLQDMTKIPVYLMT